MKKIVNMIFIAVMLCNTLGTTNYEAAKAANVTENGMDTASGSAINTTGPSSTELPEDYYDYQDYYDYYNSSNIIRMGDFILIKGNYYHDNYNDDDGEEILYIDQYLGNSSNVIIPDEYEGKKIEGIMPEAFSNNTKMEEIQLPKSLKIIEKDAFKGCTNLKKVELPKTVKFINTYAFKGCKKLTEVQLPDALDTIDYSSFDGTGVKEFTIDNKNPSFTTVDGVIIIKDVQN